MKLAVILENIDVIIYKYKALHAKNHDPIQNIFTEYVIQKIKAILKKNISINRSKALDNYTANQLIAFYREIFAVIRDTDIIAPHNSDSLLTTILLALAKQLATVSKLSKYEILLPSITVTEYEASSTFIGDSDLELNDFVLNDDSTAIIEIFNCLTQASIQGELKHTYLIAGSTQFLSSTEKDRVINHSKESKAYWKAIQDRINITLKGENFGAVLYRLATNLRKGGVNGMRVGGVGGTHENSGVDANIAIFNFFMWYNALNSEDRETLATYNAIQEYIDILQPKADADYSDTIYCVELMADGIEEELDKTPELFDIYPKNVMPEHLSGKEEADLQVALTQTALESALRADNYKVTATYGSNSYIKFVTNVANLQDLLDLVSPSRCNSMMSSQMISSWLKHRPEHERLNYLVAIKPILDAITLSWDSIVEMLKCITDEAQRASAGQIFAQHISRIVTTSNTKEIEDFFGPRYKELVFKHIYVADPNKFEKKSAKLQRPTLS